MEIADELVRAEADKIMRAAGSALRFYEARSQAAIVAAVRAAIETALTDKAEGRSS